MVPTARLIRSAAQASNAISSADTESACTTCVRQLGEAKASVIAYHGNMVASTVWFILRPSSSPSCT
eukprot:3359942-Prymnesium_polylepis.3